MLIWMPPAVFDWDILTFIGAAILLLCLVRRWPGWALLTAAAAVWLVSPWLRELTRYADDWVYGEYFSGFTLSDAAQGFLVNGYFPLCPWLVFPLVGMAVGRLVVDEERGRTGAASGRCLPMVGVGLMVLAGVGIGLAPLVPQDERWHLAPLQFYPASSTFVALVVGIILVALWILYRGLDVPRRERPLPLGFFRLYSRYALTTYVLHLAVHVWPLLIAARLRGYSGGDAGWWYYGDAVGVFPALALSAGFIAAFYLVLVWWDRRGGRWSFEWVLARLTG
jgi:uncharacterized membrane protein